MAGIYLHIPFCRQACTYCNFHFSTSTGQMDTMVKAMQQEIAEEKHYLDEAVNTIYFGGGTPSLLPPARIENLLKSIQTHYTVSADAEITLEANPDDIHPDALKAWKNIGINRLSMGVQSFFEDELRWMNRAHNSSQARQSIEAALREFDNITMDLIYGSPLTSDEKWKANVDTAIALGVPHLSCYALTVEEKTALHHQVEKHKVPDVDPDLQARQFLQLMNWLGENGYEHYEVSNFAKAGYRSRHNSAYWKGTPYLGIGPSAHSYKAGERRWNIANNALYIQSVTAGLPQRETEQLSAKDQINETVMISLRTMEGIDLNAIQAQWGPGEKQRIENAAIRYMNEGWIRRNENSLQLTDEGFLRADGIASALFI